MAEIRRVSRSTPLSSFQQVAPAGGLGLAVLADGMNQAYEFLRPKALEDMAIRGDEDTASAQAVADATRRMLGAPPPVPGAPVAGASSSSSAPLPSGTPAAGAPLPTVLTSPLDGQNTGTPLQAGDGSLLPPQQGGGSSSSGSRPTPDMFQSVAAAGAGWTEVMLPDGTVQRREGTRAWRNNNPGNIEYGDFARGQGAIGTDGRFAVFPTYEAGRAAKAALLFESPSYRNLTIQGAINRYAPPIENDSASYAAQVAAAAGVSVGTPVAALSADQREAVLDAMERVEGFRAGTINGVDAPARSSGTTSSASTPSNDPAALGADTRAALGLGPPPAAGSTGTPNPVLDTSAPMSSAPNAAAAPTMVRTSDGALAPRLYSPLMGELGQAYNNAASATYLSESLVRGQTDLLDISNQMPLNAEGFREAASGYVREMVRQAPARLRAGLRQALTEEAQVRYLGMIDEQHADIRERASNSNRALVERYTNDYAQRLAAGDAAGAEAARLRLEETLYARESLPGLAWTREQSENEILGARETAARLQEQARGAQVDQWRRDLAIATEAAINGQTSPYEGLLDDPNVAAALPDEQRRAQAFAAVRDYLPSFLRLTPEAQAAQIAEMRATAPDEPHDVDILNAMEGVYKANAEAWEEDPIARAAEVLGDNRPPAIPPVDFADPRSIEGFTRALQARAEYANDLVAQGYTDQPSFLAESEIEQFSTMMGPDIPVEARAALAGAIAAGFGDQAVGVFDALETDDVTRFGGKMVAMGGSLALATEAMRGQMMIDEGLVTLPERADRLGAFSPDIAEAVANLPAESVQVEAEVMGFAAAIYASRSRGVKPDSEAARTLMGEAVQAALGQTTDQRGRLTGGVQDINGRPTLLPLGVAGEDVDRALTMLRGGSEAAWWDLPGRLSRGIVDATVPRQDRAPLWLDVQPEEAANPGVPYLGNAPLEPRHLRNARLVPVGGNLYRVEVQRDGGPIDVAVGSGEGAAPFLIDITRLVSATR